LPEHKSEIQILKVLLKSDGITQTRLFSKAGIDYKYGIKYLQNLEKEGLIKQHHYDRITIVSLNKTSPKYQAIKTLWGEKKNE